MEYITAKRLAVAKQRMKNICGKQHHFQFMFDNAARLITGVTEQATAGENTAFARNNAVQLQLASVRCGLDNADAAGKDKRKALAWLVFVKQQHARRHTHECGVGQQSIELRGGKITQHGIEMQQHGLSVVAQHPNQASGSMCGNRMTSLILALSVSIITSRSMPMPSPAVGGRPYSSARTKSLSLYIADRKS